MVGTHGDGDLKWTNDDNVNTKRKTQKQQDEIRNTKYGLCVDS